MVEFSTYEELDNLIDENNGVVSCNMRSLRDCYNVAKLGVHVARQISRDLNNRGLGHFPEDLPINQWDRVRVFKKASKLGAIIESLSSLDEESDDILREVNGGNGDETLRKVKAMIDDYFEWTTGES
ncbi:hypothetical protein GBZ48_10520 [Azospirillum melinis]|uniref:Uncharacterized protein n=1 Tax=Azospirillum melinis TaxID=328839 RepID=A0ABX2KB52_9PROT|nr:hypothetical protein [Azospirillum melinis]MBP2304760.1 hypothetical protein [Azospirillum melinis]NUA99726.1 hypothetical protein [Azospirillum melinis]